MLNWPDRYIIVGLVVLQLAICVFVPFFLPISLDEPFSIYHAQFPLTEMLAEIQKGNNSPLHFVLLHYWIQIFGISPFAVRSLSLIFSLITVVYLFKLGRKFWAQHLAIIPVLLFIFSRLNHFVAVEARMYGLFTLFFTLILYDVYQLIVENKRVFWRLGIWNALLLYTHYLGGVVVLMELMVFLYFYKKITRAKTIQVGLAALVAGVLFIPGIAVFLNRAADFSQTGTWVQAATPLDLWTNLVKLMNNQFALIGVFALVLVLMVLNRKKWKPNPHTDFQFFGLWFLGTYVLFYAISVLIQPIFFIKYMQFLSIPLFFFITAIFAKIDFAPKWKYLPLLAVLPFLFSFKIIPDINRNTDELVTYLKNNKSNQTAVYYCPPHYSLTLAYHYDRTIFADFYQTETAMKNQGFLPIYNSAELDLAKTDILFIDFDSKLLYPENGILETLNNHYTFLESAAFKGGFNVYKYAKN